MESLYTIHLKVIVYNNFHVAFRLLYIRAINALAFREISWYEMRLLPIISPTLCVYKIFCFLFGVFLHCV